MGGAEGSCCHQSAVLLQLLLSQSTATHDTVNSEFIRRVSKETSHKRFENNFEKKIINYLNRGAQGIDIVALGIDFVAVRAWAQSVCRLE